MTTQPTKFQQWVQTKHYQFELSLAIYMMKPGEKFAFCSSFPPPPPSAHPPNFLPDGTIEIRANMSQTRVADSIFFLLCSLTFIAIVLYLPHHIYFLVGRAWYYVNGEHIDVEATVKEISASMLQETAKATAAEVVEAAETVVREL